MSPEDPSFDPSALPTTAGGYARRHLGAYLTGAVFLACCPLAMNRIDWLSKTTVDRIFAPSTTAHAALVPGLIMIGLGFVAFWLRLASRWFLFNVGRDVEYELRSQLLHKLHRLGQSFYRVMSTGDVMSRATNDVGQVRLLFGFGVLNIFNIAFASTSAMQVMLSISGRLTAAAFVTMPVLLVSTNIFSRLMFAVARTTQESLSKLGDLAQRHFAGIRVVRSFAIEGFAESRFAQATQRYLGLALRLARIRGAMFPAIGALSAISMLIVAWYGASLLRRGPAHHGISDGDLFAYKMARARKASPHAAFGMALSIVQRGRACFQRIKEILDREPEIAEPANPAAHAAPAMTGLTVSHLSYTSGARPILSDVSFELPAGRSLAIVGRTGSGKSTLAQLLVRLLPTPQGTVFLDSRDLCELPRPTLRERIGYAQQDPFLFSTSVADNVAIGLDLPPGTSIPDGELNAALRDAQIAGEVARLPAGSQTLVGERGLQLSGGQRQRVALARALVSHTPLLVLDDPLSAVDARTEAAILDALRRRAELRSIVLITNRVAAAARCDRVLVLDNGRIAQAGTHAELVGQPGLYATLAEEQRVEHELEALGTPASAPTVDADADATSNRAVVSDDVIESRDMRLIGLLWPFLKQERFYVITGLVLLGMLVLLGLLRPLAIGNLIAAAKTSTPLVRPGLLLLALLIGINLHVFGQTAATQVAGARSMATLRMHVFRFTDRLGMRLFDRTAVGRLVTRVTNDIEAIGELFAMGVFNAIGDLASLVLIVGMMMTLDYKLALIAFAAVPATLLIVVLVRRRARQAYRDIRTKTAQLNAMLNEQLTGVAVVQAFGREEAMAAQFDTVNSGYREANKRAILSESSIDAAVEMVQTICLASALLWAARERGMGQMITFATVVTFSQYLRQFFEPVGMLTQRYTVLQSGLASSERVFQFLDSADLEPEGIASADELAALSPAPGAEVFALDHVGFGYREDLPVLFDVSLHAHAGERIAIVGPTGAGKSTIAQLLLRLYDVDRGEIRVLGRDVRKWPRRELRRVFSVVPQVVAVFSGTLLENIALGDPEPDLARAEAALAKLGVSDFFLRREGGLDARVDERGLNFSVGERQLLSFARAVYHDAPVVLLDEATASIDSATEASIQRALDGLMAGRTSLVIAHRLSTIESADRILVFQHGRIVESGRHEQLIADGGLYARLHALQVAKAQVAGAA